MSAVTEDISSVSLIIAPGVYAYLMQKIWNFGKLQLEPLWLLQFSEIICIHFPVFVFLVSLLLMALNVTGCYIRVYMISNNTVTCVIAANYASGLVLQFKMESG